MATLPIVFLDMLEAEATARQHIQTRIDELTAQKQRDGQLDQLLQNELDADTALLAQDPPVPIDPLFKAVRADIAPTLGDLINGKLPSQQGDNPAPTLTAPEQMLGAVYGILERENQVDPTIGTRFSQALALGRGEYNGNRALYDNVFAILLKQGIATGQADSATTAGIAQEQQQQVRGSQWSQVAQALVRQGVVASDFQLEVKTLFALAGQVGVNDSAPPSSISIDLPDLDAQTNVEIVVDNLIGMQGLHFAAMFEEMKAFAVVDKLVEQFTYGQLPLGRGNAGNVLYGYWKKSVNRLTEIERRNMYARAFGTPGGDPSQGSANAGFPDLWMRFISTVSNFARQLTIDDLFRTRLPANLNQEQVKKSGRDLAGNLSLHGYGIAYFAATELQTQIREIIGLLSDEEIKGAFGAKDMWGVLDQVASLELGSSPNNVKYRTMATSGAIIIKWLADHTSRLTAGGATTVLNVADIRNPPARPIGAKPTSNPTDRDLVDACESWLAVTGTPDTRVTEMSQPTEGPTFTSTPIRIPAAARDLLDSVGVKPMSYINGQQKEHSYR